METLPYERDCDPVLHRPAPWLTLGLMRIMRDARTQQAREEGLGIMTMSKKEAKKAAKDFEKFGYFPTLGKPDDPFCEAHKLALAGPSANGISP